MNNHEEIRNKSNTTNKSPSPDFPLIWIAAMSIGFDINSTLSRSDSKDIKYLNNDNENKDKACKNILYFLQSRFSGRRHFITGSEKYSGDIYILTKNCRPAKIEFPSLLGNRIYIICPDISITSSGDAVLTIKEKHGCYIGYFVITDESKLLPDIETIITEETLMYPALSEQRKLLRKERPDLPFSEEVLIMEGIK